MSRTAKVLLWIFGAIVLAVFWAKGLDGVRGDDNAVVAAQEEAEAAEQAAQAARDANAAAAANVQQIEGSSAHMVRFAEQLPEIAIESAQGVLLWYERELMTPAELREYHGGNSAEHLEATPPTYYANNPTCYMGDGPTLTFDLALCQSQPDVTVVMGKSEVSIALQGWNGDCRAALGWVFSRFFESVAENGESRPSGHHLKPWVQPGSFSASVPQCLNKTQIEALRRQIDVVYSSWPISEEAWVEGGGLSGIDGETDAVVATVDDAQVSLVVTFSLLFRPAHSLLCVPNLAGYVDINDLGTSDELEPCPAAGWLAADDMERRQRGPFISDRVCLPRLPVATALPDGDLIVAQFDPIRYGPSSYSEWPASLEGCDIRPVVPESTTDGIDDDEVGFGDS